MKKSILPLIIASLILSSFVIAIPQNNLMEYVEKNMEEIIIQFNHTPFVSILPYKTKVMTFPFGTKIESIEVKVGDVKIKQLGKKESNEAYPSDWITWHTGAGIQNGKHVVFLSIHAFPCRYIPASNKLLYTNEIKIKVKYEPPEKPLMQNDVYDLIIIAPSQYSDALQPLVSHKENHGIKTKLVTLNEIYGNYEGRDDAEKIKYFIKDAIETWGIKYVLLVGDVEKLPARKVTAHLPDEEIEFLTDLYYADIYDTNGNFLTWDTNDDDIFGEFWYYPGSREIDFVDIYPDVYVGRLACKDEDDVKTVAEKIINYEISEKPWFNKVILCGGDTFPDNPAVIDGEWVCDKVASYMSNFTPIKLYASLKNLNPININANLNEGAGFTLFSGHGLPYGWFTYAPGSKWKVHRYYSWYVPFLRNDYKLPIIVFNACLCAKLDYKFTCIAWWFVRKPNGGAIATIGATELAFGSYDSGASYYTTCFFESYNESNTLGEMHVKAINKYMDTHWKDWFTLEEFILLGDPTLKIKS
ncbi:MAG: hypothetical protein FE048_01340 [Thermoplasmata archaeon]|nr:MAG: hypothetical protein FE048_01340 [Thermoplasmata archaeon]